MDDTLKCSTCRFWEQRHLPGYMNEGDCTFLPKWERKWGEDRCHMHEPIKLTMEALSKTPKAEPEKPRTICVNCTHERADGMNPWRVFCNAVTLPKTYSFVTGKCLYKQPGGDLNEIKHLYCEELNTEGECPMYEERRKSNV